MLQPESQFYLSKVSCSAETFHLIRIKPCDFLVSFFSIRAGLQCSVSFLIYGAKEPFHRKENHGLDLENRLVVAKGEWEEVGWIGSFGLIDADCCFGMD